VVEGKYRLIAWRCSYGESDRRKRKDLSLDRNEEFVSTMYEGSIFARENLERK
jgi:hypothetical protein